MLIHVHYTVNTINKPMDSYKFLSSKSYMPIIPNKSIVIIMLIIKETADNNYVYTYNFQISPIESTTKKQIP